MKFYIINSSEYQQFKYSPEFLIGAVHRGVFYRGSCTKKAESMVKSILRKFSDYPNTLFLHPSHRYLYTKRQDLLRDKKNYSKYYQFDSESLLTNGSFNLEFQKFEELLIEKPEVGFLILYVATGASGNGQVHYITCGRFDFYDKLYRQSTIDRIFKDLRKK